MSENAHAACRRNSWLVALGGGALVALMLLTMAEYGFLRAVFMGLVFAALLGAFLVWAFCSVRTVGASDARAPAPPAARQPDPPAPPPAPEPAPPAAPEPAAARLPDPPAPAPETPAAPEPAAAAPASFVTAIRSEPVAEAPKPEKAPKPKAAKPKAEKPATTRPAAGLDAALAKSKDNPVPGAPELLKAPRGGKADDLKLIKGVGPKLEKLLNDTGVWHFDQIASWKAKDIAVIDEKMTGFHGRITRDEWVKQAKALVKGRA